MPPRCHPCLRTGVTYVCVPYSRDGRGAGGEGRRPYAAALRIDMAFRAVAISIGVTSTVAIAVSNA